MWPSLYVACVIRGYGGIARECWSSVRGSPRPDRGGPPVPSDDALLIETLDGPDGIGGVSELPRESGRPILIGTGPQ